MLVRRNYILNLRYHVPKNVLDKSWLRPPGLLENVRTELLLQVAQALMELNFCMPLLCLPWRERAALAKHFLVRMLHRKSHASGF